MDGGREVIRRGAAARRFGFSRDGRPISGIVEALPRTIRRTAMNVRLVASTVLVLAIAVGRLDQQHVGAVDHGRIANDRPARLAEVTREHQLLRAGPGRDHPKAAGVLP